MVIPLFLSAITDLRRGKIYNWQSALGLCFGFSLEWLKGGGIPGVVLLLARVIGTCVAFSVFYLCRMLGAGDIKMMAVCVGVLGAERGALMIFISFLGAAAEAAYRLIKNGTLWQRLSSLAVFTTRVVREKQFFRYPVKETVHMGPWMLAGYGAVMLFG